jgi:hypothetical protein
MIVDENTSTRDAVRGVLEQIVSMDSSSSARIKLLEAIDFNAMSNGFVTEIARDVCERYSPCFYCSQSVYRNPELIRDHAICVRCATKHSQGAR